MRPYGAADENGLPISMNKKTEAMTESEIELNNLSRSGNSADESVRGWEEFSGGQNVAHVDTVPTNAVDPNSLDIEVTKSYTTTAQHLA